MSEAQPADKKAGERLVGRLPWERELRLWSGIVLFAFVTMHLLNHALGVFGLELMQSVQTVRLALWQNIAGTVLLYGAFALHIAMSLKRVARRRFAKLPPDEAVQIVLGLLIPYLLIDHLIGTRIQDQFGYDQSYENVLRRIWGEPAVKQTALVLVTWIHGCIGIAQAARGRHWYLRYRELWFAFAILVPVLSLAGFVAAAREVTAMGLAPEPLTRADYFALVDIVNWSLVAISAVLGLVFAIVLWRLLHRRKSGLVTIRYTGHGAFQVGRGTTVLEASRINGIPHPALCGGRGRCSTCRIAVTSPLADLPAPSLSERAMLERISAPPNVRLACQLRPKEDLTVQILLPIMPTTMRVQAKDDVYRWGVERDVTVLFVDIRAFNTLTQRQLPYDLVLLLNRFFREMTQAAELHQGRVDAFMADGLMAIFGLAGKPDAGARDGVMSARAMLKVIDTLNSEFGAALPIPLRIGIGVHTGPAIIAQLGDEERGLLVTALGETVTIASRLEAATKDFLTDCLVSAETAKRSGLDLPRYGNKRLHVRGREEPIILHVLPDALAPVKPAPAAELSSP
jgi:adenylate cyclase